MRISVMGTGMVGQILAGRLDKLGHEIVVGTRDVDATLARTTPDVMDNPPFSTWAPSYPGVRLATFAEAAAQGELVVNATAGIASIDVLHAAGASNLAGKVLLDLANPLDFAGGFPPGLFVKDTDSLGEQIQRAFPEARVVKTLNTLNAYLMVDPEQLAAGEHTVFVSGDDQDAKDVTGRLLAELGHRDVVDLGDLSTARGTEMVMPLLFRLWGALGTQTLNVKIVR
ncbi:NADPH-dependent F420 reductase [Amycolatopsis sp. NPDC059657]|uniref:NADPH-dependent F420 reductase n=1 Tax=Amycolatopsis sp. NPDC059657 TaxID=3346899 RepID=UPI00366B71D1